jgi:hypothetical protein
VWSPRDPHGPTSQLREALDAAYGTGRPDDDDPIVLISPQLPRWRAMAAKATPASRRALGWVLGLATLTLAGVLSLVIYASLPGH